METYQLVAKTGFCVQDSKEVRHFEGTVHRSLLNCFEVAEMLGLGVSTVWAWSKAGRLPKPIKLGAKTTRWKYYEIQEYVFRQ